MKNLNLLLLSILTLGVVSCTPKYYAPNTHNVPLISKKGESNLTISGNGNQFGLQGAYGISDNISLKLDGAYLSDKDKGNGGSGKLVEFGAGYFKPLSNNFVFETYAIIGLGSVENQYNLNAVNATPNPPTQGKLDANILRVGIQPNFGYKTKNFSAAISSRFVNLSYNKIEGNLLFDSIDQIKYLKDNSSNFLVEPAITLRGGFEKIKLQLQYGYSFNLTNSNFKQDPQSLSIGLNFSL